MSFTNRFNDDDFEDFRRYEEYQRQKDEAVVKGVGNFLYKYIVYSLIWVFSSVLIAMSITQIFDMNQGLSTIVGMILGFFLFKIQFIKSNPLKSLATIFFLFWIFSILFS